MNKKNYEQLVQRREQASMGSAMEEAAGVDFRLIDPPRVSPKPVAPNRALFLPLTLLLALAAGVGVAFAASQLRPVFFDARSLARSLRPAASGHGVPAHRRGDQAPREKGSAALCGRLPVARRRLWCGTSRLVSAFRAYCLRKTDEPH
ncbi:MAG: GNVR domain-containing protein [Candidatus Accumulibacter necessarius]|uniref:GNVR domain-containing protein n=1 Tax=Candidatus Accumulibacter necessarius TaxID=2954386 RepID=UPI002FC3728B